MRTILAVALKTTFINFNFIFSFLHVTKAEFCCLILCLLYAMKTFVYILGKHAFGLNDELIGFLWLKVEVSVTSCPSDCYKCKSVDWLEKISLDLAQTSRI